MSLPTLEELNNYKMPTMDTGAPVMWYKNGIKDSKHVELGFMMHCGSRTCTIYTVTGKRLDAVRHVDDPKLRLSQEQREQGAWDFTTDYKRLVDVCERVDRMEKDSAPVAKPKRSGQTPGVNPFKEFQALKQKAADLGIKTPKNARKSDIKRLIAKAEAKDATLISQES